jgi:hypothetical protein
MCDDSLQGLPNRLAVEGEEVVTHRFPSGSLGMASPLDIAGAESSAAADRAGNMVDGRQALAVDGSRMLCSDSRLHSTRNTPPHGPHSRCDAEAVRVGCIAERHLHSVEYRSILVPRCDKFDDGRQIVLQAFPEGVLFEVLRTFPIESEAESANEQRVQNFESAITEWTAI